jgi:hypothetical protein
LIHWVHTIFKYKLGPPTDESSLLIAFQNN